MTLTRLWGAFVLSAAFIPAINAQWVLQVSNTNASLRGIHNVGAGVAWASGSDGTVLLTTDGDAIWRTCEVPDARTDGASLDLRGIQAWDDQAAIVLSAGPGGKSRLYRTTDGCKSWKLLLRNRDKDGFWDALYFRSPRFGWLLGDPVGGMFSLFATDDGGRHWIRQHTKGLRAMPAPQACSRPATLLLVRSALYILAPGAPVALMCTRQPKRKSAWTTVLPRR